MDPAGKLLYGSNRGHDSIVVFGIDSAKGTLTFVEDQSTGVKSPRNFSLDPTGRFCLVANQGDHSVVVFRVDPATGALVPAAQRITVGNPVCVLVTPSSFGPFQSLQ